MSAADTYSTACAILLTGMAIGWMLSAIIGWMPRGWHIAFVSVFVALAVVARLGLPLLVASP